jgi:dihydroorotate dehydrogenase
MKGLASVYPYADYITINISSPNTQGLRALQKREQLTQLLSALIESRKSLQQQHKRQVPLLLKIAPDLDDSDMEDVAEVATTLAIDGMIISNTTIKRPRTLQSKVHGEQGGLSGAPLFAPSTEILARMYRLTAGKIPLVGVGGVSSAEQAYKKIRAGASLVQLYTALVYQGFGCVPKIVNGLPELLSRDGFAHVSEAVGVDA